MGVFGGGMSSALNSSSLGKYSKSPPSRESESCILVSLVIRLTNALRGGDIAGMPGKVD